MRLNQDSEFVRKQWLGHDEVFSPSSKGGDDLLPVSTATGSITSYFGLFVADMPDTVRSLALQFSLPDGELWRTAMINLPVVPVSTPEAFYEWLIASKPDPSTGKPDPAKMKAFLARHPEAVQALKVIKSQAVSSGFDNSTFHSLNAFRFINSAGDFIPVRWLMTPMQPFEAASTASAPQDKNYLFDALIAQIHRQPLRWHLMVIIGQPGDPTNDATIAWPRGGKRWMWGP